LSEDNKMQSVTIRHCESVGDGNWYVEPGMDEGKTMPGEKKDYLVPIKDVRNLYISSSIHKEGFQLVPFSPKVNNFYDDEEVKRVYYPQIEALIHLFIPGATRINIFDHTVRNSSRDSQGENGAPIRPIATDAHNDYTANSGLNRIRQLFPDEAEGLLKKRFMIINVWRGIRKVESYPLAFVDSTTTFPEDFLILKRIEPDRVGEIQLVRYNPKHQWCYFSKMDVNEAVLFKTFDSLTEGVTRFTIHSAVDLTDDRNNIPTRESIEVRSIVFLE